MGRIRKRRGHVGHVTALISLAGSCLLLTAAPSAFAAQAPYVALGESIAAGVGASSPATSYVGLLYSHYQTSLGVDSLSNRAEGNASSSSLLNGGQLASALADINDGSDTRAVTIGIGGNDGQALGCSHNWDSPSCPFRANFASILSQLAAALEADPGDEAFAAMAYFNPASGKGGSEEFQFDTGLLGDNLSIGCQDHGAAAGINDVIYQEAGHAGALVADPYQAFKQGGQSFMADVVHPNDAGHAAIAQAFEQPVQGCPPESPTKAARVVTLDTNKGKVEKGRKVRFTGLVDAAQNTAGCESGQSVELQRKKPKQADFQTFNQVQTDSQGSFSAKQKVKKTYEYRALVSETSVCGGQVSDIEKVKVKKSKR